MFYDEAKVDLSAGNGGDGCFSMRRAKYIPKGGPDGGDGGRGGNVILVGDENVGDLRNFHFQPIWKARNGEPGRGKNQNGAGGDDCELKVPLGTVVLDLETRKPVVEILEPDKPILLLRGGEGGSGNEAFKSPTDQAPRQTTPGEAGEEGKFQLVLKTIADIGLVGYPNAGKSSLIGILTNAQPKVGHYPFTTKEPSVGMVEFPEHYGRLTLADIPGLIDGASENRGLGHRFLRHIERCRILLFILDMGGVDGRDPLEDFEHLFQELKAYGRGLLKKPQIVVANKMDEEPAGVNLHRFRSQYPDFSIFPLSCLSEEGIPELREGMWKIVQATAKNSGL